MSELVYRASDAAAQAGAYVAALLQTLGSMRHAERGDEPLAHMIKLYAAHDLVHLRQIARIRQAIGASQP